MTLTHRDIILSILYYLGGDKKAVDLETLTVSCFKTFPSKFSMERFAEYPRFDRVEKRMSDIQKKGLIFKEHSFHYKLTDKGIQWIKAHPNIVELIDKQKEKEKLNFKEMLNYNIDNNEYVIEVKKLKKSETYKKYIRGDKDKISIIDFMTFLRVDVYAKKELFDRKITRIKSICMRDGKLRGIFNYLENKYTINYGTFCKEIKKTR